MAEDKKKSKGQQPEFKDLGDDYKALKELVAAIENSAKKLEKILDDIEKG